MRECSGGLRNVALIMVYESVNQCAAANFDAVATWWQAGVDLQDYTITVSRADCDHYSAINPAGLDALELDALARGDVLTLYPDRVDDFESTHWDFFYSSEL